MIELNIDEEVDYLVEKTGCTSEKGYLFIEAEYEYLDNNGLINHEGNDELPEGPYEGAPSIDNDEMVNFISVLTGIDRVLVEKMSYAKLNYMESIGLVSEVEQCLEQ
ncbi:hypothetical protein PL321_11605 [Caloramator sp. mosi_1]|uniref:hypothetical protein n=1 Tax=Caloramator sp. mosi_1 TaxID=3023090 RepID=UPI0023605F1E|nr:hypothetical protein [Caloramator sp. mosi_1]WDC83390.1 hypothetical protein PL321_11605 [Caloramator sp. mosi_1]